MLVSQHLRLRWRFAGTRARSREMFECLALVGFSGDASVGGKKNVNDRIRTDEESENKSAG